MGHVKKSLPVRECGLKSGCIRGTGVAPGSLPVRECGLKLHEKTPGKANCLVTPRAGVWIEINMAAKASDTGFVTPRAGVLIEIKMPTSTSASAARVTPRAGVWIEI